MSSKVLTKEQWSKLIRKSLMKFAQMATRERGAIEKAAEATHLSRASIEKMKSSGTGSVESWIKLLAFHADLKPDEVERFLENLSLSLKNLAQDQELDLLFEETKVLYKKQELAAWMKLLVSKGQVEEFLGVAVNAQIKKKRVKSPIVQAAEPQGHISKNSKS